MALIERMREYIFSYNKMIFHEFYLKNFKNSWENPYGVSFEQFDIKDLDKLSDTIANMDFASEFTIEDTIERIEKGYFLFVAKHDNRIIGLSWLATNQCPIPYFDAIIHLKPDEFFSMNAYVHKSFRGKSIFNLIRAYAYNTLKQKGYQRALGAYFTWNKASWRMNVKFGTVPIGYIAFGYFFTFRYLINRVASAKVTTHTGPLCAWKKIAHKSNLSLQSRRK